MTNIKNILNIEDSYFKHIEVNRALRWNHYPEAEWANDGKVGVAKIEEAIFRGEPFDLLILDMHVPINGHDDRKAGKWVIKELARRNISLPIIICSSFRYEILGTIGSVWYNENRDLNLEFREVLKKLDCENFEGI